MVEIGIELSCRTPLNIGSGAQQGTLAQRGMLKDAQGWPYIPASTLKGRLRHGVEQIALSQGVFVCHTHQDMCRENFCLVCQVFGSPWQMGLAQFTNLTLAGPADVVAWKEGVDRDKRGMRPRSSHRFGVALNRQRRVAEDALLYRTELLWPGLPLMFKGTIRGTLRLEQAAYLVAGLYYLPALGRSKSSGLGWIATEVTVGDGQGSWNQSQLLEAIKGNAARIDAD